MSRALPWFLIALLWPFTASAAHCQTDFESPVIYSVIPEARAVVVGDVSGDGRDDAVLAAGMSGLCVLYQQSDGWLAPPEQLYAPNMPTGLALGELNGDSRLDLVVGGSGGAIFVYYQQPEGTFGLPSMCVGYGVVNSIAVVDLNRDGLSDIADTSSTYPIVMISYQLPDGTFDMPVALPTGGYNARCLQTLDYDSDGITDIAVLLDNQVCLLQGLPAGGFAPPAYIAASYAYSLVAGDVTGDGQDDLIYSVAGGQPYASIGVVSQGAAAIYPAYDYPQAIALLDASGDGRKDVAAVHSGYEALSITSPNADGTLGGWTLYGAPYCNSYEPGAIAVGDLNSDGKPDLAVADQWNGLVVYLHSPSEVEPLPDTTSPTCSISLSGTLGNNGWYLSAVNVAVTAQDEVGGSGLAGVYYTMDGTTWSTSTGPVLVSEQGETAVGFYAVDLAGNQSDAQWVNVKIDTVPPVIALQPQLTTVWPPNNALVDVPVNLAAADATSGVAALHLSVSDEYGLVQPELDVVSGVVSVPLVASRSDTDPDGRVYTLTLTGTDAAGNVAAVSSTVIVPRSKTGKPDKPRPDKPGRNK